MNQLDSGTEFKKIDTLEIEKLNDFKHGSKVSFRAKYKGIEYEFSSIPSENRYVALDYIVAAPLDYVDKANKMILSVIVFVVLISLVISIIVAFTLAKMITSPLNSTVSLLKDISEGDGDLTKRLPQSGIVEMSKDGQNIMEEMQKLSNLSVDISNDMDKISTEISDITHSVSDVNEQAHKKQRLNRPCLKRNQQVQNIKKIPHQAFKSA